MGQVRGQQLWTNQIAIKGTLGAEDDITPVAGTAFTAYEFIVNAPLAADDATLDIWADTADAAGLLFSGFMGNRDADGGIQFPLGVKADTKFIVKVSGATNDTFILMRYS